MRITPRFHNDGEASLLLQGQNDCERAMLAYIVDNPSRIWRAQPQFNYRPSGVQEIVLSAEILPKPSEVEREEGKAVEG